MIYRLKRFSSLNSVYLERLYALVNPVIAASGNGMRGVSTTPNITKQNLQTAQYNPNPTAQTTPVVAKPAVPQTNNTTGQQTGTSGNTGPLKGLLSGKAAIGGIVAIGAFDHLFGRTAQRRKEREEQENANN